LVTEGMEQQTPILAVVFQSDGYFLFYAKKSREKCRENSKRGIRLVARTKGNTI